MIVSILLMKKYSSTLGISIKGLLFIILVLIISSKFSYSQGSLFIGLESQKTVGLYWENGLSVSYSLENREYSNFSMGVKYLTSRLGTAISSNALKQDYYIATFSYQLLKEKKI